VVLVSLTVATDKSNCLLIEREIMGEGIQEKRSALLWAGRKKRRKPVLLCLDIEYVKETIWQYGGLRLISLSLPFHCCGFS